MINLPSFFNPVNISIGVICSDKLSSRVKDAKILLFCSKRFRKSVSGINIENIINVRASKLQIYSEYSSNPTVAELRDCILSLKDFSPDTIIAIGGGSTMDLAKACKAFFSCNLPAEEFIDSIIFSNVHFSSSSIYSIAIPTTSGTGSEVTPFATLWDSQTYKKLSLNSTSLFFDEALIDPSLTYELPFEHTLSTALDAYNQAAESLWNRNRNIYTQNFASNALAIGLNVIPNLCREKSTDPRIRHELSLLSLYSGLAISHTRTALCHSISYPLTARYGIPHGLACAFTMPEVYLSNLRYDNSLMDDYRSILCINDPYELYLRFKHINTTHDIQGKIKQYIPTLGSLLKLIPEMYNPDRAGNNINPKPDIERILKNSWL